ncbi:asparagine synthase (glutamine-hydrolysing) [Tistlia consotensis]|uniref:asparagine synthase (glutamine-hydrolyzing) n=1 Tax=Tistlia consotensis USBA 355 TaxID=560819 RepID=A0A1Y6BN10_9PROT|nr:N-acetylglutaminylglutamine amidotransferase [Tistlia consotensis]SMF16237.1 asparagine synthase (glutamine-hydrolysing) [Tistlia consotensis USBA 355]SNR41304.1 asparagine synthase (glutamine-hydrolysing) [Tistlia consotensis]
MCGIVGEIRFDGRPASATLVQEMARAMQTRGPDAEGLFVQNGIAVGHRRLKIIDHSEAAQQPMIDPELGLGIVYNGAIYNYPELRAELEGKGHRFFSHGDTEVILKAYRQWGEACVEHFNGMFAFALWERDSGRLFLARDRLGIKPLYLAEVPGGLRFGSSLPAVARGEAVDRSIDPVALHHYLSFHAVVPAPHTILTGVRKLPPGHTLTATPDGRMEQRRYWRLAMGPREEADLTRGEGEWVERVLEGLRASVRRRLVADTPVGVLLSGGVDSSLVVGLLSELGQTGLKTFSVGFESAGGEAGDEFQYSDIVAERYATDHTRIRVDSRERLLPNLDGCIRAMSEPMVSHDNIGFYLLSEEVSKHVRVVQSGQGADEIFAGYHWYPPLLDESDETAAEAYARVFADRDHADYAALVEDAWLGEDHSRAFVRSHFDGLDGARPVDKALHLDTTVMLVDDPVKRVDNMTMAWGLEARVPFLDHELVELAACIPAEHKVAGDGKHVLKQAARRVIPAEVIDRPKGYFPVPALKYLDGPVLDRVRDTLDSRRARERGLFRRDTVERLLQAPSDHITPLGGSKLWQIALLESWLQLHGY